MSHFIIGKLNFNYNKGYNQNLCFISCNETKLEVNAERTKNELYKFPDFALTDDCKSRLEAIFLEKLNFLMPLLMNLGIDFYQIANKQERVASVFASDDRNYTETYIVMKFYGKFISSNEKFEALEFINGQEYQISITKAPVNDILVLRILYKDKK